MLDDEKTMREEMVSVLGIYIQQVEEELSAPEFRGRSHYLKATYSAGCRGPLCTTSASDTYYYRKFLAECATGEPSLWDVSGEFSEFDHYRYRLIGGLLKAELREIPMQLRYMAAKAGLNLAHTGPADGKLKVNLAISQSL